MSKRVLVIDDEPSVRLLLTYAFRDADVDVDVAATATEGLTLFEMKHYDVAYVDLHLPDLSGDRLIERLRALRDVPIVMITAEPEDLVPGRNRVDGYLNKPFKLTALEATLSAALQKAATSTAATST
jgi:DNA-binding response OmpR family regulator